MHYFHCPFQHPILVFTGDTSAVQSVTPDTALSPHFQVNKHSEKLLHGVYCQHCQRGHSAVPLSSPTQGKPGRAGEAAVITGPLVQGCFEIPNISPDHQQVGFQSWLAEDLFIKVLAVCSSGWAAAVPQLSKIYFLAESQVKYQTPSKKPSATFTF